jgi:N-acetylglutamate synthase-like GNAT family acetyltransferase
LRGISANVDEFKARKAVPADTERVVEMLRALENREWDTEGIENAISSEDPFIMLAETEAGHLIGLGFLYVFREPSDGENPVAEVRQILVLDDWWGLGVGATILEGLRVVAVEKGCKEFRILTR